MDDRDLLEGIRNIIGHESCSDDCAVLTLPYCTIVTSTDMLHEKSDFPAGITDWQIGWMSAAVTISDIAAMGAYPLQIILAIGLDREERLYEIVTGADACCREYGVTYGGGDLDAHDELTIVSSGLGIIREGKPVKRSGAREGDLVCVTGILGRAIPGLSGYRQYWKDLCEPQPRVSEGISARIAGASAMMDISDGLSLSLYDISEQSCCGMEIISASIPLPADIDRRYALDAALFGGGDFELLFFISPGDFEKLDINCSVIGKVIKDKKVLMDGVILKKKGYLHHW